MKTQQVIFAEGFTNKYLQDILRLEQACFPSVWQYAKAAEYYAEMLKDIENMNLFLCEETKVVGYLLVTPFKAAWSELKEYDPSLLMAADKLYIETIQIMPVSQGKGGARMLLTAAGEAGLRRGINKFAIHARVINGLHLKIKRIFEGSILLSRPIEKWKWGDDEPYEYIEWEYARIQSSFYDSPPHEFSVL
jgi:GNAT superfamily N-acetyltransferase